MGGAAAAAVTNQASHQLCRLRPSMSTTIHELFHQKLARQSLVAVSRTSVITAYEYNDSEIEYRR